MKYKDLIQFDPIDEIIKFSKLDDEDYKKKLVKDFVCSESYENYIIPRICAQLDLTSNIETKGIQIVGNYGTGKSHLMSLFSIVAEDKEYLQYLHSEAAKDYLKTIAGKYKVYRFEMGGNYELWDIITYRIDKALEEWGVDYSITDDDTKASYADKLEKMMAAYEEAYPGKGFMLVIDEMLSYLKGRSEAAKLARDLQVLQALGQMSDRTHFRLVFGVQELIYRSPEFQFAKEMLSKVNERFMDLTIQKEDVQYIVQKRLLLKDEHQKVQIRQHLKKFAQLFPDMNSSMEKFVNLFPVHPSYFDNFSLIRIGKSQREVLKTLSSKFTTMMEEDVPNNEPGLICYDSYWQDMLMNVDLKADPNVRKVSDVTAIIDQKIEENFTGPRARNKGLAHRMVSAAAIKILQADLDKANGVNAETLANDLCCVLPLCDSFDFLVDSIASILEIIVKSTLGEYFEKGESEYHIRIEGGKNYEEEVRRYRDQMGPQQYDGAFFMFLTEILPVEGETYRTNFKIWLHHILWHSHKCQRTGYIFMGNPSGRSTTQPEQHFYIYFLPIFNKAEQKHGKEQDSVYFLMENLSDELKYKVTMYGAAFQLEGSASSDEKPKYKILREKYYKESRSMFNNEFLSSTSVEYMGISHVLQTMQGSQNESKIDAVSDVASYLLKDRFEEENRYYPKFDALAQPIDENNRENMLRGARVKIMNPTQINRNAEAILMGLGLWEDGHLSTEHSQYARSLKQKLDAKGGRVLNRDEILEVFYAETNEYISSDFHIEADLEFIVMATMAALGEIEIVLKGGSRISAGNISDLSKIEPHDFYDFSNICQPRGINLPVIRELMIGLLGADRTAELDNANSSVFAELNSKAAKMEDRVVKLQHKIMNGCQLAGNIEIISQEEADSLNHRLDALRGICNNMQRYNTKAKMRNIDWPLDMVKTAMHDTKAEMDNTEALLQQIGSFEILISYLRMSLSYIADKNLKNKIEDAIDKLNDIIHKDKGVQDLYKKELEHLKEEYADYYMSVYVKAHIREVDYTRKQELLNSETCSICKMVNDAVIINPAQYEDWLREMSLLKLADSCVNKQYLMSQPASPDSFNPVMFKDKLPKLSDLKTELDIIFEEYDVAFHEALKDADNSKNKDLLTQQEKEFINQFNNNDIKLDSTHARTLVDIVKKLQQNFTRIEIEHSDVVRLFSRPMTKAQAIERLTKYIEDKCSGHNPEDIRIIIK